MANVTDTTTPSVDQMTAVWFSNNTTPFYDDFRQYGTFKAAIDMYRYANLIAPPIGIVGNILCLTVLLQKSMRKNSPCIYMAALAFSDAAFLAMHLVMFLGVFYVRDVASPWSCKFIAFFQSTFSLMSSFIIVAMTFERYIAISMPLKACRLCTPKRAFITITCLMLFALAFNLYFFWAFGARDFQGKMQCSVYEGDEVLNHLYQVMVWFDASLYVFTPCVALPILNFLIVRSVRNAHKLQKALTQDASKQRDNTSKQLTVMLLAVTTVFLVCMVPVGVWTIVMASGIVSFQPSGMNNIYALRLLINQIITLMRILNHCVNFFLYCITGQRFRKCFARVYCFCCCRRSLKGSTSKSTYVSDSRNISSAGTSSMSLNATD